MEPENYEISQTFGGKLVSQAKTSSWQNSANLVLFLYIIWMIDIDMKTKYIYMCCDGFVKLTFA